MLWLFVEATLVSMEHTRADFKNATVGLDSLIRAERGQGVSENKLNTEIVLFYRTEIHILRWLYAAHLWL